MRWSAAAAAGLAASILSAASAAAQSPWYVEGSVGGYFRTTESGADRFFQRDAPTVTVPGVDTLRFSPGVITNLGLGYRLTPHLRLEAEAGYFGYNGHTLNPYTAAPGFPALNGQTFNRQSGDRWTRYSATANAFYDFAPIGGRFTPYVGGGVGVLAARRSSGLYTDAAGGTFTTSAGSSTAGLALLEGGVGIAIAPHWTLVPAYRYVHRFAGGDEQAHVAKVGLRYAF